MMSRSDCWKFAIGIKGMIVKKKITVGKIARKKLKEIADARVVIYPFDNPFTKKTVTS
jgi:hypothetical protein